MNSAKKAGHVRENHSVLARVEKKTLIWIAERLPLWINSDHPPCWGSQPWSWRAGHSGRHIYTRLRCCWSLSRSPSIGSGIAWTGPSRGCAITSVLATVST